MIKGQDIQELRKSVGLNPEDFARLVGVTARTIFNLESGKHNPAYSTLEKIEGFCGDLKKVIR